MKTIWKYPLKSDSELIYMPDGAEILSVQVQNNRIVLWTLVESDHPEVQRLFITYYTGQTIRADRNQLLFVGTVQRDQGLTVEHVFEFFMKE